MINDMVYKKMYYSIDSLGTNWQLRNEFLREDEQQRVYKKMANQEEYLLYDFSLVEGDTINLSDAWLSTCELVVESVDFITLDNGEVRKRLGLVGGIIYDEVNYWIEGIGSVEGLLKHYYFNCVFDYPTRLLCHYQDEALVYQHDPTSCFLTTSTEAVLSSNEIKIYPNPANDFTTVELKSEDIQIQQIRLQCLTGQTLQTYAGSNEAIAIDTRLLPNGMYILQIELDTGQLLSKKFLRLKE